jgi:hypothetical protein
MNQNRLADRVIERLELESATDELAWLPAVGWLRPSGEPYGLAVELFGEAPSDSKLRVLSSVLIRLAGRDQIEIARFPRPRARQSALSGAASRDAQTRFELVGGGSNPLQGAGLYEYGVRLVGPSS